MRLERPSSSEKNRQPCCSASCSLSTTAPQSTHRTNQSSMRSADAQLRQYVPGTAAAGGLIVQPCSDMPASAALRPHPSQRAGARRRSTWPSSFIPPLSRTLRRIGRFARGGSLVPGVAKCPRTVGISWGAHDGRKSSRRRPVTTVDIESLLAQDELRALLDTCEQAGTIEAPRPRRDRRDARADRARAGRAAPGARQARASRSSRRRRVEPPPRSRRRRRRVDHGRAAALPARGRPPPAADRGAGGRPREADRARRPGCEAGDDPVEPPAGRLDRQELPQPGPAVPRPDPGGHARPDPRRREVRLAPRLQVLDVRDLVDPPGGGASARRQGADDPDARAHRRAAAEDQPRRALALDAARTGADARRDRRGGHRSRPSRCWRSAPPHARRRSLDAPIGDDGRRRAR